MSRNPRRPSANPPKPSPPTVPPSASQTSRPPALQRARDCITDAVATIIYGADLPWSRMIIDYVRASSAGGRSQILGAGKQGVHPAAAALAQGAMAHAFELDNLTKPDSGCHPGAVLFSSGLATAQDRGLGGRDLVTALVAGTEVMIRIGYATGHTDEERGFHAPSAVGPFGGAVTVGRLMGFDAARMTNAMGIAGSCSSGLLAFAHSGDGAMVKRFKPRPRRGRRGGRRQPGRLRLHRPQHRHRGRRRLPPRLLPPMGRRSPHPGARPKPSSP